MNGWRAVGEFVLLESHESVSNSGLITDTMYTIHSIGKQVASELTVGDSVVLSDDAILSSLQLIALLPALLNHFLRP